METRTEKKARLSLHPFFPRFYYLLLSLFKNGPNNVVNELTDENEVKRLANQLIGSMINLSSEIEKLSPEKLDKVVNPEQVKELPLEEDAKEQVYSQGMELYLPLTQGVVSFVNSHVYDPKPFGSLVLVLPGDIHRHISRNGKEPARVLTMSDFGLTRGPKVELYTPNSKRFPSINRYIGIK